MCLACSAAYLSHSLTPSPTPPITHLLIITLINNTTTAVQFEIESTFLRNNYVLLEIHESSSQLNNCFVKTCQCGLEEGKRRVHFKAHAVRHRKTNEM